MNALADNVYTRPYLLVRTQKDETISCPLKGFEGGAISILAVKVGRRG
ncbi:hypothetical protein BH20ACI2_BH20ACI2_07770 [soil metagenome]